MCNANGSPDRIPGMEVEISKKVHVTSNCMLSISSLTGARWDSENLEHFDLIPTGHYCSKHNSNNEIKIKFLKSSKPQTDYHC